MNDKNALSSYEQQLSGSFTSLLRWSDFDEFWQYLRQDGGENWYLHVPGNPPPTHPLSAGAFHQRLHELESWLKQEHQESYCGIVYVDNKAQPSFIKIYDPHNLGVVCGIGREPIPPAWTISKSRPSIAPQTHSTKYPRWLNKFLRV